MLLKYGVYRALLLLYEVRNRLRLRLGLGMPRFVVLFFNATLPLQAPVHTYLMANDWRKIQP